MKNILFFFVIIVVFSILPHNSYGQKPRYAPQVHEVSLSFFSVNKIVNAENTQLYNNKTLFINPLNGIRYRYSFDKSTALRVGAFYRKSNYAGAFGKVNVLSPELRVGLQTMYNIRKVQLYAGADGLLSGRLSKTAGIKAQNSFGIGGSGILGIRYFFHTNLSITMENDVYFLNFGKQKSESGIIANEMGFNFTSIALSYHFKPMKKACTCGKPPKRKK
jgi:hypothetical protein